MSSCGVRRGRPLVELEQDVLLLDQELYDDLLVAHVVERRQGVLVGRVHQRGSKDDPQILSVHKVVLLVHGHPVRMRSQWRSDTSQGSTVYTDIYILHLHLVI